MGNVQHAKGKAQATQSSSASTTKSAPFESRFSGEYTIQAVVGRGGFGVVFKAQHELDKRWYAIKRVYVADTEQSRNKVLGEVRLMAPLDHPHIVRYCDAWLEKPPPGWQQEHDDNLLRELRSRRRQQNGKENNISPDPEDVTQMETELLAPGPMVLVSEGERIVTVSTNEITNQIRADDMSKEDACPVVDSKLVYLYIRMEFCCGSTLHKWLRQNQSLDQRPISQTLDWFNQLASAVKYIHDAGLIHRDIKPGNIFFGLSRDGAAPVLKIGDLGLAIDVTLSSSSGANGNFTASSSTTSSQHTQSAGTPSYMSPEQESGNYMNSTDIFSLGLVFLEMLHPFKTDRERYAVFGALRSKQRPAMMNKLDKEMDALIRRMTAFGPEKRATSSELDNELRKMLSMSETNFTDLPPKLMLKIFGYLCEGDLTRCALVSRKFRAIANRRTLWKSLYQEVFEYSLPLLHVGHGRFEFREPHESIVVNPWKESFKQLKDGVHVRPGYASLYSGFGAGGRRLTQCDRLDQAFQLVKARGKNAEKLIFLHAGLYIPETTVTINSDIQIIGASAGPDIASRVIIEGRLDTTVVLAEGSQGAYLGWMTVRFVPDSRAAAAAILARNAHARPYHYALQICGDSTALVEHCVIQSSATVGAAVYVHGSAANPKMRRCVVCDCKSGGICVTDEAQGQFEDCEIARNGQAGVLVNSRANRFFRRCHIHDGHAAGIYASNHGMGYFESCNIHNNLSSGIEVRDAANPTVTHCEVHHGQACGILVHKKGRGQFMENRIHSNAFDGIEIKSHSDPRIARNKIWSNQEGGVCIHTNGQGVLEENEIFDNAMSGVWIETDSNPILRRNKIYDGRDVGVHISNKGRGILEENDIYRNAQTGVLISSESNPKIARNKIWGNQKGVLIYNNGQGVLEENEIFDNAMPGVGIYTDGNPTLRRNKIYDGRSVGIYISNKGRGVLEENDIYRNTQAGVVISSKSNPILRRNRVYEGCAAGIEIRRGAMATLESNVIFHNRFGGLCLATGARPTLHDNKIYDNDSALPPVDSEL